MSSPLPDFIVPAWAIVDDGVDGRGLRNVMYLCETEARAKSLLNSDANGGYYRIEEVRAVGMDGLLIEVRGDLFSAATGESKTRKERIRRAALAKLNAEEKRLLGIVE